MGAFLGAAILYGTYADGINNVIGKNFTDGAAGIFASYPNVAAGNVTLVMDQGSNSIGFFGLSFSLKNHLRCQFDSVTCLRYPFLNFLLV